MQSPNAPNILTQEDNCWVNLCARKQLQLAASTAYELTVARSDKEWHSECLGTTTGVATGATSASLGF